MASTPDYQRLTVDLNAPGGIATITLQRPEKRNALDILMLDEYCDVLRSLHNSPDIRVIVTRGAGPSFCAGMDLHELSAWAKDWDRGVHAWSDSGPLTRALTLLREHTAITLAGVHGYVAGGGLALMVAHDLAIASSNARFILPETARGSFGALAAAAIHHALPPKKAFDMQLTGSELNAADASMYGLVSRTVDDADFDTTVDSIAAEVARRDAAPLAHAKMAYLVNEGRPFIDTMRTDLLVRTRQDAGRDSFRDVDGFLAERKARES